MDKFPLPPKDAPDPGHWAKEYRAAGAWLRTFLDPDGRDTIRFYWAKHRVEEWAGFYVSAVAVREAARALGFEIKAGYTYGCWKP